MNDFGKDIGDLFKDNIYEEYENYVNNKVDIQIKVEKPNKNMDFGQDKVLIEFNPENQKKFNNNISIDELIYNVEEKDIDKEGYVIIIGENFCKENNDKVDLIINGKKENLCHKYKLQKGINKIKIIFKKDIQNYSYLFCDCSSLSDISSLSTWDVSNVNNLTCLFYGCNSLKILSGLRKWNVKNVNHFSYMFYGCTSLTNLRGLKNWDVSNGIFFNCLFSGCTSLKDISALKNGK